MLVSKHAGTVVKIGGDKIYIKRDKDGVVDIYKYYKFKRSNQGTTINQRPIVKLGDHIEADEIICDGPSTSNGEIALGKNILIAFMTWKDQRESSHSAYSGACGGSIAQAILLLRPMLWLPAELSILSTRPKNPSGCLSTPRH